jgi:hypothetical protein
MCPRPMNPTRMCKAPSISQGGLEPPGAGHREEQGSVADQRQRTEKAVAGDAPAGGPDN